MRQEEGHVTELIERVTRFGLLGLSRDMCGRSRRRHVTDHHWEQPNMCFGMRHIHHIYIVIRPFRLVIMYREQFCGRRCNPGSYAFQDTFGSRGAGLPWQKGRG